MSKYSAFCIAASLSQANRIVDQLKFWSFSNKEISVLVSDESCFCELGQEWNTKASKGTVSSSRFSKALSWITRIGAPATMRVSQITAARPAMLKLSNAAIGGVDGQLVKLGIPEITAEGYEVKMKAGNLLISVQVENALKRALAKDIFTQSGAEEIGTADEYSPPNGLSHFPGL
ncbi:hypothetical protein N9C83_02880 [Opitutales bacterium]|nr:hypothetical protein [Opitutales bacterium]